MTVDQTLEWPPGGDENPFAQAIVRTVQALPDTPEAVLAAWTQAKRFGVEAVILLLTPARRLPDALVTEVLGREDGPPLVEALVRTSAFTDAQIAATVGHARLDDPVVLRRVLERGDRGRERNLGVLIERLVQGGRLGPSHAVVSALWAVLETQPREAHAPEDSRAWSAAMQGLMRAPWQDAASLERLVAGAGRRLYGTPPQELAQVLLEHPAATPELLVGGLQGLGSTYDHAPLWHDARKHLERNPGRHQWTAETVRAVVQGARYCKSSVLTLLCAVLRPEQWPDRTWCAPHLSDLLGERQTTAGFVSQLRRFPPGLLAHAPTGVVAARLADPQQARDVRLEMLAHLGTGVAPVSGPADAPSPPVAPTAPGIRDAATGPSVPPGAVRRGPRRPQGVVARGRHARPRSGQRAA